MRRRRGERRALAAAAGGAILAASCLLGGGHCLGNGVEAFQTAAPAMTPRALPRDAQSQRGQQSQQHRRPGPGRLDVWRAARSERRFLSDDNDTDTDNDNDTDDDTDDDNDSTRTRPAKAKAKAETPAPSIPSVPSRAEEWALLGDAAEYRRLETLRQDAAMRSPSLSAPRPLVLAREAGYGDDVDSYQHAYDRGLRAREALVTRNVGLVHHVVDDVLGSKRRPHGRRGECTRPRTHSRRPSRRPSRRLNSLSRDDLIQEGCIGLARAVDKYDRSRSSGARFGTYATYWIRASVLRGIAEKDDVVRVPVGVTEAIARVASAASALGIELDGDGIAHAIESAHDAIGVDLVPSDGGRAAAWREFQVAKALASEAGLTGRMLKHAMRARRRRRAGGYTSLDESWAMNKAAPAEKRNYAFAASATPLTQSLTSTAFTTDTTASQTGDDAEELKRTLGEFLNPKELEALSWRYGLIGSATFKTPKGGPFRDYEDEAMNDLFGTGGILSSASPDASAAAARAIDVPSSSLHEKKQQSIVRVPTRSTTGLGSKKYASDATTAPRTTAFGRTASAPTRAPLSLPQRGRWGEAMSFAEVGKHMAVSAEYGRRLCQRALDKLRKAAEEGRLEMQPEWLV